MLKIPIKISIRITSRQVGYGSISLVEYDNRRGYFKIENNDKSFFQLNDSDRSFGVCNKSIIVGIK